MIKRWSFGYTSALFVFLLFHSIVLVKVVFNTKEKHSYESQAGPRSLIDYTDFSSLDGNSPVLRNSLSADDIKGPCFGVADSDMEQCLGEPVEDPIVSPMVVLDPKHMNYSYLPFSKYRNKYHYDLESTSNIDQKIMVSILTPFYNSGKYIHDAAKNVFGQSFQLFEWIIVNDGSNTTQSLNELAKYRDYDPRITIIDLDTNLGLPGARNHGVKVAKGKYLLLLDPDDMIEQTYLEKAVWFLETHPQFTLTNAWSVGFGYKEYTWARGFQAGDSNLHGNEITVATLMRTSALRSIGAFDESLTFGMEDWDLWMRMADNGHWGYTLEEFLFWYRVSPPGKWKWIDEPENFKAFHKGRQDKYSRAFTKGVPKVSREAPMKYAPVPELSTFLGPVSLFNNRLSKCKPRIMVILPTMEVGGADQFNYNFLQGLALEGYEITIVATKHAKHPWLSAFARLTGDIFVLSNFVEINQIPNFLVYLVESRQPDIVFVTNSETGYLYVPYIKHHCPWVTIVDYVHSETPLWKDGGYARYSFGLADVLDRSIYASEHLRQYVIERGHYAEKTATVRIGVDIHAYKRNEAHRNEIRSMLDLPADKMLILYVARLADEKQPLLFASVMKELADKGRDYLAVSIGDGELYDELNRTITKYGITDKVKLWGAIPNKQVSKWMSAADIFFLPSKVEGISLAIYEAMSLGVTCVSSNVGGQAELVNPEVGSLVKPGSPDEKEQYVKALDKLVANPEYTRKLGQASRDRVVQGFSSQDALQLLKKEFCVASKMNNKKPKAHEPALREYAALVSDYFRLEGEAVSVWRDFLKLRDSHNNLLDKINTPPEYPTRAPSPFLDAEATPENVLQSIKIGNLRLVDDILEEKNIDLDMEITLKTNMGSYFRKNPKVAIPGFNVNDWNKIDNHDVKEWNDKIPYVFKQMQYVAQVPNAYTGIGQAATVFDYDRVFMLKKGSRTMFDLPDAETTSCNVIKHKKLINLVQIWGSEFGHFMSEVMPRLSLVWKEFNSDPEMKLLVPNLPFSRTIFERILKIDSSRLVWYNFGPGWTPCTVHFAETMYIPTPNPTGNPVKEQVDNVRKIFVPSYDEQKDVVVYFSRRGLDRAVSNEEEVVEAIRAALPEGVEIVVFEPEADLIEVFEHMKRAKAIIGSHGSTLAPMMWAEKGTAVIEYLHEAPWLQWWATATALEHDYWMVPVENTNHEAPSFEAPVELTVKTVMVALGYEEMDESSTDATASN